jgi:hypothetical protein
MRRLLPPLLTWLLALWVLTLMAMGAAVLRDQLAYKEFARAKDQAVCNEAQRFDTSVVNCGAQR